MRAPEWNVRLPRDIGEDSLRLILEVPGLRVFQWGGYPTVVGPANAVSVGEWIASVVKSPLRWKNRRPTGPTWDALVDALAARGEARRSLVDDPFPWQREVAPHVFAPGRHLWWPPGAGKTRGALLWALASAPHMPLVCVVPAKVRSQWARVIRSFTTLDPHEIKPASIRRKRDATLEEYVDARISDGRRAVFIGGLEALPSWAPAVLGQVSGTAFSVVYDEIHRLKSNKRNERVDLPDASHLSLEEQAAIYAAQEEQARAQGGVIRTTETGVRFMAVGRDNRAKHGEALSRASVRRLATTGTPFFDRAADFWGQGDIIEPFAWGRYRVHDGVNVAAGKSGGFTERYAEGKPGMHGGWDARGASCVEEFRARLAEVTHFVDFAEVAKHLPKSRTEIRWISPDLLMTPPTEYGSMIKAAMANGPAAVRWCRLAEAAAAKRPAIADLVEEYLGPNRKIVVFTGTHAECEGLGKHIAKQVKGTTVRWSHGGDSPKRRAEVLAWYTKASTGVLVGTWDAWGESIDGMQCTDVFIGAMLPDNPGKLTQGTGRFTRGGQDRPVLFLFPVAERTIDVGQMGILMPKLKMVGAITGDTGSVQTWRVFAGLENADENRQARAVLAFIDDGDFDDED